MSVSLSISMSVSLSISISGFFAFVWFSEKPFGFIRFLWVFRKTILTHDDKDKDEDDRHSLSSSFTVSDTFSFTFSFTVTFILTFTFALTACFACLFKQLVVLVVLLVWVSQKNRWVFRGLLSRGALSLSLRYSLGGLSGRPPASAKLPPPPSDLPFLGHILPEWA